MTVTTTSILAGPYLPNGSTTVFPFAFKAFTPAEVSVVLVTSGAPAVTIDPSLYSVTLNDELGGSAVFPVAPVSGPNLYVVSAPDFTQQIAFTLEGAFLPQSHDEGFDRSALRDQVLADGVSRSLRLPVGTSGISELQAIPTGQAVVTLTPTGDPVAMTYAALSGAGGNDDFDGGLDGISGNGADFDGGLDG